MNDALLARARALPRDFGEGMTGYTLLRVVEPYIAIIDELIAEVERCHDALRYLEEVNDDR